MNLEALGSRIKSLFSLAGFGNGNKGEGGSMAIVDPSLYQNIAGGIGQYLPGQTVWAPPYPQPLAAEKECPSRMANIKIEKIENGYLVIYSKQGVPEKRRFAADMRDVGDAVIAACTELELLGK